MKLSQFWKKICGRPSDEPFDPRRDLLKPRVNRLETCEVDPGLYHYVREVQGVETRFHLRVDSSGSGVLLANAAAAARLRSSGVIIAKGLLDGEDDAAILRKLHRTYHGVSAAQAAGDIEQVRSLLYGLEQPGDNFPILNLGDPSFAPDISPLRKPLSADVPLADRSVLAPLLDRLWEEGIPHVTLLVREGFDRSALVRAVERAEDLGMIAGVRARGTELAEEGLIAELAASGVDHINVLHLSPNPEVHDRLSGSGDHAAARRAMEAIRAAEICRVAEICLVEPTLETLEETIEALAEQGITNAGFFALATEDQEWSGGALTGRQLVQTAETIEKLAEEMSVRYLWYPPVQAARGLSLAEQVCRGPRTSGDHAVRVETDGSVVAARGPWRTAGNLLGQSWETIARSEVYQAYWRRVQTDTHCAQCPGLVICAADCPRTASGWAEYPPGGDLV